MDLTAVLFVIGMLMIICALAATQIAFARLRRFAPTIWEELGRPHLMFNNTPGHSRCWFMFIVRRRYRSVKDPVVRGIAVFLQIVYVLTIMWLALMMWLVLH